jgi:hypothetical protein
MTLAVVIASPTEELLSFPAALSARAASDMLLLAVLSRPIGEKVSYEKAFYDLAVARGIRSHLLGRELGEDARLDTAALSEDLRNLFREYRVDEVYTHAIQGDKGHRYRADVAMSVWLATGGKSSYFRAKHTTRVSRTLHISPERVIDAYKDLLVFYGAENTISDVNIAPTENYTFHTWQEAKTAYYEISHGLEGVRRLVGEGDTDPWGYLGSAYALARAEDTLRLTKRGLSDIAAGVVWEVGPASGHITEQLLALKEVSRVEAIERFEEFRRCLNQRVVQTERLVVRQTDVRNIRIWNCAVALLVDCMDYYLTPLEQERVVLDAIKSGARVVLGGEASWASAFIGRLAFTKQLSVLDGVARPGSFEPIRQGFPVHVPRPPWAAYLLVPST